MKREAEYRDKFLKCPFCMNPLGDAIEIENPFGGTVEGGFCGCGTTYVFDRSGRMLGEAYTEALAMAFNWDYDAAFSAEAGSYEEEVVRHDNRTQKFLIGDGDRFDRSPKYYFIKRARKPSTGE